MIKIINNISLKIPDNYYFSFTNSPYYAHWKMSAVDIYPKGREILSPFSGKLIFYRNFHGEHISGFESDGEIIRILHLKPAMEIGDKFDYGDFLGYLQDSPTFRRWTDYHIHFEIRENENFLRARGVKKLNISKDILSRIKFVERNNQEGMVRIIKKGKYILVKMKNEGLSPIIIGNEENYGFLEGGIPHYGHAGIIGKFEGDNIILDGKIIGKKIEDFGNYTHIKSSKVSFFLENIELIGISLYLNFQYLKIIPRKWDFDINIGDKVKLRII